MAGRFWKSGRVWAFFNGRWFFFNGHWFHSIRILLYVLCIQILGREIYSYYSEILIILILSHNFNYPSASIPNALLLINPLSLITFEYWNYSNLETEFHRCTNNRYLTPRLGSILLLFHRHLSRNTSVFVSFLEASVGYGNAIGSPSDVCREFASGFLHEIEKLRTEYYKSIIRFSIISRYT